MIVWDRNQSIRFIKSLFLFQRKAKQYLEITALLSDVCGLFNLLNGCGPQTSYFSFGVWVWMTKVSCLLPKAKAVMFRVKGGEKRSATIYPPILLFSKKKVRIHGNLQEQFKFFFQTWKGWILLIIEVCRIWMTSKEMYWKHKVFRCLNIRCFWR